MHYQKHVLRGIILAGITSGSIISAACRVANPQHPSRPAHTTLVPTPQTLRPTNPKERTNVNGTAPTTKDGKKITRACCGCGPSNIEACNLTVQQNATIGGNLIVEGAITNAANDEGFTINCITITNDTDTPREVVKVGCQAQAQDFTTAVGFAAQSTDTTDLSSTAVGWRSSAQEASSTAFGDSSLAGIGCTTVGARTFATGPGGIAVGNDAVATGEFASAVGVGAAALGSASTAVGNTAFAGGQTATALGNLATADSGTTAAGWHALASASNETATALGWFSTAVGDSTTAVGDSAVAVGENSTAVGTSALATDIGATALGKSAIASFPNTTAVGSNAVANADDTTAVGTNAQANATSTTAVGFNSQATDELANAFGVGANASGPQATALGSFSSATGPFSTAIGVGAQAFKDASTAAGNFARATENFTTSFGQGAWTLAEAGTTLGYCTTVEQQQSTAIGAGAYTTKENQMRLGSVGDNFFGCLITDNALQEVITTATIISERGDIVATIGNVRADNGGMFAVSFNTVSDANAKQNIQPANIGLDFIEKLKPVIYQYAIGNDQKTVHCGLLAQEILQLIKDNNIKDFGGITYDAATGRYNIAYTEFIAPLIKAIQELAEHNSTLTTKQRTYETTQQELIRQISVLKSTLDRITCVEQKA